MTKINEPIIISLGKPIINGFLYMLIDLKCDRCKRTLSIRGEMPSQVTCPHCNKIIDLKSDKEEVEKFKETLRKRQ